MRLPALFSFAFAGLAVLAVTAACSNQGEGEFCDSNNGNNDCQNGYECIPAPGVPATPGGNTDRCCPGDPALATTSACEAITTTIDAGTAVPDASPVEVPDAEAGVTIDSSSEAGVPDATVSGDAGPDGSPDGGAASDASDGAPEQG